MTVKGTVFKDRRAILIQGGSLEATFLPEDGAKMASLRRRSDGKELLAVKAGESYGVLTYDGDYVSSECSGFDDMCPTVDPYTPIDGPLAGLAYPDHGECCRIPYAVESEDGQAVFRARSRIFPIEYEKRVCAEDDALLLAYQVKNLGDAPFDFLWAGHIMLKGEDGMTLLTPFAENAPTEMMFAPKDADASLFPKDRLMGFEAGSGAAYKFYYTEPISVGHFEVRYPDGSALSFEYDEKKLPYLGVWLNNGAFQDSYTVTPEPCTVPFDAPDRAAKRGITSLIPPKASFCFQIKIRIKEINI